MRIKIKIFLENASDKKELAEYLIDCLGQKSIGENIVLTTNEDKADIIIDLKELKTKEEAVFNLDPIVMEISRMVLERRPILQPGQKKIRKKLHNGR